MKHAFRQAVLLIVICLLDAKFATATVWRVPTMVPTISTAAAACAPGDTIAISVGTYFEHNIALQSGVSVMGESSEFGSVIIDAQGLGRAFSGQSVVIEGLTIVRGISREDYGGGALIGSGVVRKCLFESNSCTADGGAIFGSFRIYNSVFRSNTSFRCGGAVAGASEVSECEFYGNYGSNSFGGAVFNTYSIIRSHFAGNDSHDGGSAVYCENSGTVIVDCTFTQNGGFGMGVVRSYGASPVIRGCTFYENATRDYALFFTANSQIAPLVENCTIVGEGTAIVCNGPMLVTVRNTIIAFNRNAFAGTSGAIAPLECCVVWSNTGLAALSSASDIVQDPLFCDLAQGGLELDSNSPCLPENSGGCGLIGAQLRCNEASFGRPVISDVPDDQGGYLVASWRNSLYDSAYAEDSVSMYDLQRYDEGWHTIVTLAAVRADSYAVTVPTIDILTDGQPVPFSRYRTVARTITGVMFESDPDSGYSIDNLPPPRPEATLVDSPEDRTIFWARPTVPDFAKACVYRGSEAGFTAGEPLACPSTRFFEETDLGWYFYRVQFSDIHGNLSEFSDELHGQWPTPVPGAVPTALRLYPCQPNPFNPRTTIKYDLPEAGPVRLSVFDVAGRLVRTLVDEGMPQGSHEAVWDGRDASGREVGSGSYLARLEFGGKVETVRMGLIR